MKRSDRLFRILYNDLGSVLFFEGLVWRVKLPLKGEHFTVALILNQSDLKRQAVRHHSQSGHRGVLYTYLQLSMSFYTNDMYKVISEVVEECSICATYFHRQRITPTSLENWDISLENSFFSPLAIDFHGPLRLSEKTDKKVWIMVTISLVSSLKTFHLVPSLTGKDAAIALFHEYFKNFGTGYVIISDRGSNFLSDLFSQLLHLSGILHRVTTAHHPSSNKSEFGVKVFSQALKSIMPGKNLGEWKNFLSLVQLLSNSTYSSPNLNQTSFELLGGGSSSGIFSPLLLFDQTRNPYLSALWKDKIKLMSKITRILANKYQSYLSIATSPLKTAETLGVKVGDKLYYKSYAKSARLAQFSSILPKWKIGTCKKILGWSSIVLEDDITKTRMSRYLGDVFPLKPASGFQNLYEATDLALKKSVEDLNGDDFGGIAESQLAQRHMEAINEAQQAERKDFDKDLDLHENSPISGRTRSKDAKRQ